MAVEEIISYLTIMDLSFRCNLFTVLQFNDVLYEFQPTDRCTSLRFLSSFIHVFFAGEYIVCRLSVAEHSNMHNFFLADDLPNDI